MRTLLWLLFLCTVSHAQIVGGNTSLSVTTVSSNVTLPAQTPNFPSALIAPAPGSIQEIFYKFGDNTVSATTTDASLPSGGICLNVGPNTNIASVTSVGTATLRVTKLSTCAGFSGGGASGLSGVTVNAQPYLFSPVTGTNTDQHGLTIVTSQSLTVPADALFANVCASGAGTGANYRWDGTAPTASVGNPLTLAQCVMFSGRALIAALRFINQTGATIALDVAYSK